VKRKLKDEIRDYANAVDRAAPPVEDLLPAEMAEELGLDQADVQITTTLTPPEVRRPMPGWVTGLAAAATVVVLMIPVWLWLGDNQNEVAQPTPTTVPTPTTLASPTTMPGVATTPSLTWDPSTSTMSGGGWAPESTVTLTQGKSEFSVATDPEGQFVLPSTNLRNCCFDPVVVTDGSSTVTVELPVLEILRVDPERDVIAGMSSPNQEVHLRILGTDPYATSVSASGRGAWVVDVGGAYDILPGMNVEVWAEYPDMTVTVASGTVIHTWLGLRPDQDQIEMGGFRPLSPVTVAVDGRNLPSQVFTDAAGSHNVELQEFGIDLGADSVVSATDGTSTLEKVVPLLTYDVFDPTTGLASGSTNLADGTSLQVEVWTGATGSDEPDGYMAVDLTVSGGTWRTSFQPVASGLDVFNTNVTSEGADYWIQVNFEGPLE
jgi:hypothetical protein